MWPHEIIHGMLGGDSRVVDGGGWVLGRKLASHKSALVKGQGTCLLPLGEDDTAGYKGFKHMRHMHKLGKRLQEHGVYKNTILLQASRGRGIVQA